MKTLYITIIAISLTGFASLATQATSECMVFCQADASQSAFLQIDKNVYLKGDVILLYGSIGNYTQGYNVTVKILDKQENILLTKTTTPKPDSSFLLRMPTNDTNWKTGGPYDLRVQYGTCCYIGDSTFIFYAGQLPPLKQEEAGIPFWNIKCNSGLVMMMKQEDGAVACVKSSSLQKLISLKWGYNPSEKLTTYGLKDVYHVGQEIDFKFRVNGFGNFCEQPTVTVRNSDQKIVWQSSQYATGCAAGLSTGHMEDEAYLGREPHLGYDYNRYGPLIINQTGTYFMNISWLDGNITKQFTVISPVPENMASTQLDENNTKGVNNQIFSCLPKDPLQVNLGSDFKLPTEIPDGYSLQGIDTLHPPFTRAFYLTHPECLHEPYVNDTSYFSVMEVETSKMNYYRILSSTGKEIGHLTKVPWMTSAEYQQTLLKDFNNSNGYTHYTFQAVDINSYKGVSYESSYLNGVHYLNDKDQVEYIISGKIGIGQLLAIARSIPP